MLKTSWFWNAFIALIFLIPAWMSITFFNRNFNIKGEVFLLWYLVGIIGGTLISFVFTKTTLTTVVPSAQAVGAVVLIGLTLGTLANIFIYRAVAMAPNPGLPTAVTGTSSVFVFLFSALLAVLVPKYFSSVKFDWQYLVGVVLSVAGIMIVALKK